MNKRNKLLSLVIIGISVIVLTLSFLFPAIIKRDETTEIHKGAVAEDSGASQYDRTEKGGAVYIEAGATYTMKGGTLMNFQKRFGGAVYIAKGATFTMESGTITGCKARYGGAIYVESGGYCYINGGSITGNSATYAPAIYYEDGAILEISDSAIIENNTYADYYTPDPIDMVSADTVLVGNPSDNFAMHYINFGMFPQTYVGDAMNTTLENWYTQNNPTAVKEYDNSEYLTNQIWYGYSYIDGYIYARGISRPSVGTYLDGTDVHRDTITWFKVEPIKWVITNYDAVSAGTASSIECLSYLVLTGGIRFYPEEASLGTTDRLLWVNSTLRTWLNEAFYESAFSTVEKEQIQTTTVKNNIGEDYESSTSDESGTPTYDKVFCKSYYEINQLLPTNNNRLCAQTDYALSNYAFQETSTNYPTATRPNGGTSHYWLRSAGSSWYMWHGVCYVNYHGELNYSQDVNNIYTCVRPALQLNLT